MRLQSLLGKESARNSVTLLALVESQGYGWREGSLGGRKKVCCGLRSCSVRGTFPSGAWGLLVAVNSMHSPLLNFCNGAVISVHGTCDNLFFLSF